MFSLIKFELMKLAKKRTNIITVLVGVMLTIIFFSLLVINFNGFDSNVKGFKAIALERENMKKLSNKLTEEQVTKDIKEYQNIYSNPKNFEKDINGSNSLKEDVFDKLIMPKYDYLWMLAKNYTKIDSDCDVSNLAKINLKNGAEFYKARDIKISNLLNENHKGGNYSEQEKKFWIDKNSKVQKPYTYGYHEGWESMLGIFGSLIFMLLAICITVAPVFAGEYQCRADAVILSSKYGKTKLIRAKIIATFIFVTIVFFLNIIFAVGIPLLAFGVDGWNLPIQIYDTIAPYNVTFASCTLISVCIFYLVTLGVVSLTLFLSAKFKSSYTVLIIDIAILFISLFMSDGADNGLYEHILYLLPYEKSMWHEFKSYLSYSFGGITLSLISMRALVYSVMIIGFLPFIGNAFRKHQVQ
ncbi:ABC transporter permease [Clostridium sp. C8-1-8]|uniref:ABC transporter permease n=1 Tax=Clostridium sp. C8-1-8 TaxID=2698831 RepID=UPI001371D4E4|nr:ABC transporter permease [Clostridium sp. C8-1-8]